ncbi:hypothetical protein [Martelella sp. HB161492]|uniref:hypothetical protein n=1 Tax=Martelella sp. HB161492 TaxID=2720726 RepID=UPI0015918940|nr:hypothetical protein [Martelella sp. HB161492]
MTMLAMQTANVPPLVRIPQIAYLPVIAKNDCLRIDAGAFAHKPGPDGPASVS